MSAGLVLKEVATPTPPPVGYVRLFVDQATGTFYAQFPNGSLQQVSGIDGAGVAAGGTTGQALVKVSATDFDTAWATLASEAQGLLADTAVQPGDDADALGSGVAADGQVLTADGLGGAAWEALPDVGDVDGPASAVSGNLASFDGVTGKLIQDSGSSPASFATAAQGALADTAVQPARAVNTGVGLEGGGDLSADRTLALTAAAQASLALADTATQPGDDADTLGSGVATDGQVLAADGVGGAAWEDLPQDVTINAQTGTAYTLVLTDRNKMVTLDNALAVTVTIPTNAAVAFPVGAVVAFMWLGAGAVTIQGDTGVTVNGVSAGSGAIAAQYQTAALLQVAADTWVLSGGLA